MQYENYYTDLAYRNSQSQQSYIMVFLNFFSLRSSTKTTKTDCKSASQTRIIYVEHHTSRSMRLLKRFLHMPLVKSLKFLCGLLMTFQQILPLNITSRIWGWMNSIDLPVILRKPVYRLYSLVYGCLLDEMLEPDMTKYRNLSEFFRRAIRPECRPIDYSASLVSPVDARVLSLGPLKPGQMQQVKGISYTLKGFLGPISWQHDLIQPCKTASLKTKHHHHGNHFTQLMGGKNDSEDNAKTRGGNKTTYASNASDAGNRSGLSDRWVVNRKSSDKEKSCLVDSDSYFIEKLCIKESTRLYHIVLYLAPGDYHRFHSPANWFVNYRRHFPGKLYSVNPLFTSWIKDLFCLNERACYMGEWEYGFFSMTAVGANNVGSITVTMDPALRTNRPSSRVMRGAVQSWNFLVTRGRNPQSSECTIDPPLRQRYYDVQFPYQYELECGNLFGEFNLGSTIVLIFEAPAHFQFQVQPDQTVKVGQALGKLDNLVGRNSSSTTS